MNLLLSLLFALCSSLAFAAPPLPDHPAAKLIVDGDMLNPEFTAPAAPIPPVQAAEDDAFARATVALAGQPAAAAPGPVAAPEPEYEWYIPTWLQWGLGVLGVGTGGWYVKERLDPWEKPKSGASPAPTPVAPPIPADVLAGSPVAEGYTVILTGDFVGSPRATECGTFTPGLSFAPAAQGVPGGVINAYISSKTCAGGESIAASWTPGRDGEIVISCPDEFYYGPARLAGESIVLRNGTRLAGGTITIKPDAQATR